MKKDPKELISIITQTIYDKKGFKILALDVKGISTITDYIIVAEGNVDRHVIAIAKAVEEELKKCGETPCYIEGMCNGDWIVMDYLDIMVHLFMPGLRDKYQLERLWSEGKLLELNFVLHDAKNVSFSQTDA